MEPLLEGAAEGLLEVVVSEAARRGSWAEA
jgi:hypothetical protein